MITLYLYENKIQYMEKEEIKEYTISKKAMKYGKIKNIPLFEEELIKLIKKEKWSTLIYSKKIKIILPIHYEEIDKQILTSILKNNGIKIISYVKESTLFNLKKNQIIINIHDNYFTILKKKNNKIEKNYVPTMFFKSLKQIIKALLENNSEKYRYYFLGSNKEIITIIKELENRKIFYFNNASTYLLEKEIP